MGVGCWCVCGCVAVVVVVVVGVVVVVLCCVVLCCVVLCVYVRAWGGVARARIKVLSLLRLDHKMMTLLLEMIQTRHA